MYEEKVTLVNEIGLHARPASIFIREAVKHGCDINVEKDGRVYNAKSIMSVLSICSGKNSFQSRFAFLEQQTNIFRVENLFNRVFFAKNGLLFRRKYSR